MRLASALLLASATVTATGCGTALAGGGAHRPALPTLVTHMTEGARIDLALNDLPITHWDLQPSSVLEDMTDLPPYYFRTGTNTLRVRYNGDVASYPDLVMSLVVAQLSVAERKAEADREPWDPMIRPATILAELVPDRTFNGCASGNINAQSCVATLTFEVPTALPTWTWTTGDTITNTPETRASLRAAYTALHAKLAGLIKYNADGDRVGMVSSSKIDKLRRTLAAGMPDLKRSARLEGRSSYSDLDDLFSLLRHPSASLHDLLADDDVIVVDLGDEMRLDIFANGKLARLWHNIPLFYVEGGGHDAPSGMLGPYSVGFDIWFRLDGKKWTPAAIWRIDPMPDLP